MPDATLDDVFGPQAESLDQAAAWRARGAAMTIDQAVTFARRTIAGILT